MYHRLDKWLKQMSAKGWHIVDCGLFYFLFEKGAPKEKEYFTYSADSPHKSAGRFSISLRYPFLDVHFGVNQKKSKINLKKPKYRTYIDFFDHIVYNINCHEMLFCGGVSSKKDFR